MTNYQDAADAQAVTDRPVPDGYTDQWDSTIWHVGHVFRWSDVYECWLDCDIRLTVKPNVTLGAAFEDRMYEPMWLDYAVFFVLEKPVASRRSPWPSWMMR